MLAHNLQLIKLLIFCSDSFLRTNKRRDQNTIRTIGRTELENGKENEEDKNKKKIPTIHTVETATNIYL